MSAITVIYNRGSANIDRKIFNMVFSKLDYRSIDGNNAIVNNGLAIGHQHFWTTPEEVGEKQPIYDASNRLILAFDGRIDNREELFNLANNLDVPRSISDARLFLELFIKYGDKIFEKVIGPFLIIIYDKSKKELILARDPVGDRTIYYYHDDKVFIASSEEHSILEYPSVSDELNEKSIVNLLMLSSLPDYGETFFRDIKELPPAHKINIVNNNISISRYWKFKKNNHLNHRKSIDELSYEYLLLLEKAVNSCLRSVYEPAVMMSGGIDSTTIASIAANVMVLNGFKIPLTTLSGVFNDLSNCDERRFIDDLAKKYNINAIKIPCDDAFPLSEQSVFFKNPNTPFEDPFAVMSEKIYSTALKNNNRVILTGHFGDDLYYMGKYEYLLELAKKLHIAELIMNLLLLLNRKGLTGFFKDPAIRRFARFYRVLFKTNNKKKYSAIFTDHALMLYDEVCSTCSNNNNKYINLNSTKISTSGIPNAESKGIDLRYPYRNRHIIDFVNNIPKYHLFNRGEKKLILKNTLKEKLPKSILNRNDNISLLDLYNKGLPLMTQILSTNKQNSSHIWKNYVKESTFLTNSDRFFNDINTYNFLKWCCVSLELWSKKHNYIS